MGQVLVGVFSYGQLSVTQGAFAEISESERISALTRHPLEFPFPEFQHKRN